MRLIIIFIFALLSNVSYAQIIEEMPTDESGMINFNEVVEVKDLSMNDLYLNSKTFFVDVFNSAQDVIQMDDKEDALLIGKGFTDITITTMGIGTPIKMYYTIKIQSKEGRYKYEIYDLFFKSYPDPQVPETTTPAEKMFAMETYYKRNGKPRGALENYKEQTLLQIDNLRSSIINSMQKTTSASSDW